MAEQQVFSWTNCIIHTFIYLLTFYRVIFSIIFSWFAIFSARKDYVNVLCWEKGYPWTIWPCCAVMWPTWKTVLLFCFIFSGSLWRCELSSQVAFTSLCRRKGRWKKSALFYLFIVPPCLFSLFKVMVAVLHFSL